MAEYLLQARLKKIGVEDVLVESAGTMGIDGNRAAQEAIKQMNGLGVDMGGHRARLLEKEMIEQADKVIVMENYHKNVVMELAPGSESKIVLMGDYLHDSGALEIPDPYGRNSSQFTLALNMIKKAVEKIAEDISENSVISAKSGSIRFPKEGGL